MLDARRERLLVLLISPVVIAVTVVASLSGYSAWDDEGLMLSSASVLASGGRLYDDVRSFYGPVFHGATALLASTAGPTHTVFRLTTALVVLLTVAASYALARRALPPLVAAAAALTWWGCALSLISESLHPGWFGCLLLVPAALWLDAWARTGRGRDLALAGLCCGLQGGLKPNVAVFAVLGAGAFVLARSGASARLRAAWAGFVGAALVAILVVPLTRTAQGPSLVFWSIQIGLALVTIHRLEPAPSPHTRPARAAVLLGGGMLAGVVLWGVPMLAVADVRAYVELLRRGAEFATVWWMPVAPSWGIVLVSLTIALLVPAAHVAPRLRAPVLSLVATAGLLAMAWAIVAHRPGWLAVPMTLGAVTAALVTSDRVAARHETTALLAVLDLLQHFHGFPVAGTQLLFGSLFLMPLLFLALPTTMRRVPWLAALLLVAAGGEGTRTVASYAASPPLRLPGTSGVRAEGAPVLEELIATIRAVTPPDAPLLTLPGQLSLNRWSERPTVVRHHSTHWIAIDPLRRDEIHARLGQVPWIVINPQIAQFYWVRGGGVSAVELEIAKHYERAVQVGPFELWRRR